MGPEVTCFPKGEEIPNKPAGRNAERSGYGTTRNKMWATAVPGSRRGGAPLHTGGRTTRPAHHLYPTQESQGAASPRDVWR